MKKTTQTTVVLVNGDIIYKWWMVNDTWGQTRAASLQTQAKKAQVKEPGCPDCDGTQLKSLFIQAIKH